MRRTQEQKKMVYENIMKELRTDLKKMIKEAAADEKQTTKTDDLEQRIKNVIDGNQFITPKLRSLAGELSESVEDDIEMLKTMQKESDPAKLKEYIKNLLAHNRIYLKTLNKMTIIKK